MFVAIHGPAWHSPRDGLRRAARKRNEDSGPIGVRKHTFGADTRLCVCNDLGGRRPTSSCHSCRRRYSLKQSPGTPRAECPMVACIDQVASAAHAFAICMHQGAGASASWCSCTNPKYVAIRVTCIFQEELEGAWGVVCR